MMTTILKNSIGGVIIFVSGAACGIFAGWKISKNKYEEIAEEDRKARMAERKKTVDKVESEVKEGSTMKEAAEKVEAKISSARPMKKYTDVVRDSGYTGRPVIASDGPYIITPAEFGTIEDYDEISLSYYADEVLAEDTEIVDDLEASVGTDFAEHFGEYEEDAVYVRNDRLKCDFEILLDKRRYSTVMKQRPRRS